VVDEAFTPTSRIPNSGRNQARTDPRPAVGFIGLGDDGLPMATAIAEAGFELHVWARRPASLDALADTPHVRHDTVVLLAEACDSVELCVSTDEDVLRIAAELLPSLHPRRPLLPRSGR
jgi:3-hydroxyisobutyrate dehydrogenase-like beta-hydroxyacid dehydrogenase